MTRSETTLPDIACEPGGVLLIGINPAPDSVAAGRYYQGRHGRRLWARLQGLGLLEGEDPGEEDDAFRRVGNGLTDLVKRPSRSAADLSRDELTAGVGRLRDKIRAWRPGLILFAYRPPAEAVLADKTIEPGRGPDFEGVPTFLLTSPYARRELAHQVDGQLRAALTRLARTPRASADDHVLPGARRRLAPHARPREGRRA